MREHISFGEKRAKTKKQIYFFFVEISVFSRQSAVIVLVNLKGKAE